MIVSEVTNKIVGDTRGRWEPNDRGFNGVVLAAPSTDLLCDYGRYSVGGGAAAGPSIYLLQKVSAEVSCIEK